MELKITGDNVKVEEAELVKPGHLTEQIGADYLYLRDRLGLPETVALSLLALTRSGKY